ncbi:MAG: hypothetical protein R2720_10810 [Candidatus Nanopelagicales bacterium]
MNRRPETGLPASTARAIPEVELRVIADEPESLAGKSCRPIRWAGH